MNGPLIWISIINTVLITVALVLLYLRSSRSTEGAGREIRDELRMGRDEARGAARELREEISSNLRSTCDALLKTIENATKSQQIQLELMTKHAKELTESNQTALEAIRNTFDSRIKQLEEGNERKLDGVRKEVSDGLKAINDSMSKTLESVSKTQQSQLESMTKQLKEHSESNQDSLERIRSTFDARVKELQEGNERKLDEMRKTVDEKLHDTLEKRLGESFKLVSDRLESVHKGLGEMQSLAIGVGDLKRVLTNVKARGTWAEIQLGAILEQILTPGQFGRNVQVKDDSAERVEFAVRLPGAQSDGENPLWLPIDSKFPQEDYLRLQEAAEKADVEAVQRATEELGRAVRNAAKEIHDKYINPPNTTDFAIMFLATDGLYAEVLRQPTLVEEIQQRYQIIVAGPQTLSALLNSLRLGFQCLAIKERSSEVWKVLGAVKTEFTKFGDVLDKVKKQLGTASKTIEETGKRSRAMERKLKSVEQLPDSEAAGILALDAQSVADEDLGTDEDL